MLDEPDSPQSDAATNDFPSPPRGRRAASRPAGPPKPLETPPPPPPATEAVEPAASPAKEAGTPEAAAEVPQRADTPGERGEIADEGDGVPEPAAEEEGDGVPEPAAEAAEDTGETVEAFEDEPEAAAEVAEAESDRAPAQEPDGPTDDFESELQARIAAQLIPRVTGEASEAETAPRTPRTRRTPRTTSEAESKTTRRRRKQTEATGAPDEPGTPANLESGAVSMVAEDQHAGFAEADAAGSGPAGDDAASATTAARQAESADSGQDARAAGKAVGGEASAGDAGTGAQQDAQDQSVGDQSSEEQDSEEQGPDEQGEDSGDDGSESGSRRRRRRRGGRRRRRGGSNGSADQSGDDDNGDSDDADGDFDDDSGDDSSDDDGDADGSGGDDSDNDSTASSGEGRRRRRRRRRRGEDTGGTADPDTDVVVKVREPRRGKASDEITGIEGSTRLEAKRQRRREGRAAGRRRTPILSEAEFLARRESVARTMVIRQNDDLAQIAVLEDGVLVEHYVDRASASSLIGNVYLGRVQNVLPSMEAAFVDIGRGRNAVLYAGEVDWDSFGAEGQARKVEKVLKSGQTVLVQVTKDPVGAKGARLTNHISLPGRYIVYSPGGHLSGISRKLPDTERRRLKEILGDLIGDDASVIVRTAAEGSSEEELVRDVNRLKAQWEVIEKKVKAGQAPQQLYAEPDATVRIVRDLFTEDFTQLVIDGNGGADDAYETVTAYVSHVAPHLHERIERWDRDRGDVFAAHRVDEQIAKALERKVFLPSGGSLIIDRTEAMTVIDVNTGKFTGSGGNLEATVTSNNLEAAEEVVRQLRLRDIGGIIVIDFIDMVLPSNRELLLRRLVECLGRDRTRHQVAEVTSLGLVQMTRKKIGTGLAEAFTQTCEHCKGRGYEIHELPVDSQSHADGGDRRRGRRPGNGNTKSDSSRSERRRSRGGDDAAADSSSELTTEPDNTTATAPHPDQDAALRNGNSGVDEPEVPADATRD